MAKHFLIFFITSLPTFIIIFKTVIGTNLECINCKSKKCTTEEEFYQCIGDIKMKNASRSCEITDILRIRSLQCLSSDGVFPCQRTVSPGTMVTFRCPPYYYADSLVSKCMQDGTWSDPVTCIPECGRIAVDAVPLIMYGSEAKHPAQWPWAAALYKQVGHWELICGGTLITDKAVVTAAHCVHGVIAKDLIVVLGYLKRHFPKGIKSNYIYKVKRTYILPVYRGTTNSYNSDIAVVALESLVMLSENIKPVCLPDYRIKVTPYTMAVVAGWGLDENLMKSERLKYVQVPIIDTMKCIKYVPKTFKRYLSYSAFCAGYLNGTGVCNGDSGSGLMTQDGGKWVLQGVISVSPRKGTANVCHPHSFSLYTKVMIYIDWINKVLAFEENMQHEENKLHQRKIQFMKPAKN